MCSGILWLLLFVNDETASTAKNAKNANNANKPEFFGELRNGGETILSAGIR